MACNRRDLLKTACAAALVSSGAGQAVAQAPKKRQGGSRGERLPLAHATLSEAMAAAGFDPHRADAFTVVFTADIHYGSGDPSAILPPMFAEVHRMDPAPTFFAVAGDLINKASLAFGNVPGAAQRQQAIEEFRLVKKAFAGLDTRIPLKLALGNHDTYPGEDEPRLFHSVFPEHPEYHAFKVKGVSFVFLNGGPNALPDDEQRDWFRQKVQELHRPGETLLAIFHQPSLGSIVKERGVTRTMREGLRDATGNLWMVGGHEHYNHTDSFRLPSGALISQATITKGNSAVWGEEPGYWIWCFSNGRLAARIFRRVGEGFAVAAAPPLDRPKPLLLPFEGREQEMLWKVLVGEGDTPYLVDQDAAWCLNYWFYVKHLTYRFPLKLGGPDVKRLCVLETHGGNSKFRCLLGPDPKNLLPVERIEHDGSYAYIELPATCRDSGFVTVRLEDCVVSGFGLTA
jgi:hypothetical protein